MSLRHSTYLPLIPVEQLSVTCERTGRGSSIGSVFDPHVRHILSWRLGHENISTAILPLPLIQEEQLSVTGERSTLSTGKLPRRLAQEQGG